LPKKLAGEEAITAAQFLVLESELDRTMSADCKGPSFQPNLCEWGFGSTMNSIVKPAMHALKYGYCMKDPAGWKKFNCSSWQTLFEPVSKSVLTEEMDAKLSTVVGGNEPSASTPEDKTGCAKVFSKKITYNKIGQPTFFFEDDYKKCVENYSFEAHGDEMLPESHKKIGMFASVSLILNHMWRPNKAVEATIAKKKSDMNWPADGTPILGIHYRAGDACLEEEVTLGRKCDKFDYYMKSANLMQKKYGIKHIYLATDSDTVIDTLDKYPNFTFHYQKGIGRGGIRNKVPVDDLLHSGRLNGCDEAGSTFIDTHLLGSCHAFVGKFSSNIDRIAYNLMFARTRRYQPHISLDNNWCFDFGVKSRIDGISDSNTEKYYC
jgi:hypothetical protein